MVINALHMMDKKNKSV